jgi:23S rRNA (guanine2445-N2)-methyltransferase / 23S rRNA (guanine2069-N7)-methyltransferase
MTSQYTFFATTAKGLELLLVEELKALGALQPAEKLAGVSFQGDLEVAYKACLWSRLSNRILLFLAKEPAETPEALYQAAQSIDWSQHFGLDNTFAVHFVSSQSAIDHTLFGAQKVKDAIADQFRERLGERPNVSREQPDVSVYVYLHRDQASIYLDLSGESLHKRGYRLAAGAAPLKENLAAGILMRANWPAIAKIGGTLVDPMCGSGTLLIEGAMMAADIAPQWARDYFGFLGWKQHQPDLWQRLKQEALARREAGLSHLPAIAGYDQDPHAVTIAFENIERAGFAGLIHVEKRNVSMFAPLEKWPVGLVVTNPPYGERLGEEEELKPLYTLLGERLKAHFVNWQAAVFTGNPELGKEMGIRAHRFYALFNGALPCKLFLFEVTKPYFVDRSPEADNARLIRKAMRAVQLSADDAVQMFVNRLQKNYKHLKKQSAKKNQPVYRVYDADLPEYAFAIDIKEDKVMVQEYQAPRSVPEAKVIRRRQEALSVLPDVLEVAPEKIYFSILQRKK